MLIEITGLEPSATLKALADLLVTLSQSPRSVGVAPTPAPAVVVPPPSIVNTLGSATISTYGVGYSAPAAVVPPPPVAFSDVETPKLDNITPPAPPPPPPPPSNAELDSEGQPWNPEIHASSKAKVSDGTWRKKRGGPVVAPTPVAAPAPVAADTVVVPPPPPPADGEYPTTVAALLPLLMPAIQAGRVTHMDVANACQDAGVPLGLPGLEGNPAAIAAVCVSLGLV